MMRDRVCDFVQSGKFCRREIMAVLKANTMATGGLSGQWCWLKVGTKSSRAAPRLWLLSLPSSGYVHTHISLYSSSQSRTVICVQLTEKHLTLLVCLFLAFFLSSLPWLSIFVSLFPFSFQSLFNLSPFFCQQLWPQLSHTTLTYSHILSVQKSSL